MPNTHFCTLYISSSATSLPCSIWPVLRISSDISILTFKSPNLKSYLQASITSSITNHPKCPNTGNQHQNTGASTAKFTSATQNSSAKTTNPAQSIKAPSNVSYATSTAATSVKSATKNAQSKKSLVSMASCQDLLRRRLVRQDLRLVRRNNNPAHRPKPR